MKPFLSNRAVGGRPRTQAVGKRRSRSNKLVTSHTKRRRGLRGATSHAQKRGKKKRQLKVRNGGGNQVPLILSNQFFLSNEQKLPFTNKKLRDPGRYALLRAHINNNPSDKQFAVLQG